jgi:SAM-dependent methyltransferase
MSDSYEPKSYWSRRLEADFDLRGTGHAAYSARYNTWLYRQKAVVLRKALADVPRGVRALDVGSGVGWVVAQLLRRGFTVEGCDITDVAVERLTERFPSVPFLVLALGQDAIPRDDHVYDVVTMLDVAYHIVEDDVWVAGLRELRRVLKPGGRLIVTDRLGDQPDRVAAHVRFRSREDWENAGGSLGLRLIRVSPLFRWLARDAWIRGWSKMPDHARGATEYLLERAIPRTPQLRWAVFVSESDGESPQALANKSRSTRIETS